MATLKFKGESPYKRKPPSIPNEDYIYRQFAENVTLKNSCETQSLGIALFGAGRAGTFHLPNLVGNPRIELLYIIEDDISKWSALTTKWNLKSTTILHSKDSDRVFLDERVRAVIVASPTQTHERIVLSALENRKAVLCEKPITEDAEKLKRCLEEASTVNQPLLAAFNRRFDPAFDNVQRRVRGGEVGHVISIKVSSKNHPLPSLDYLKSTSGIFHDTAIHDIDIILFVLGEYPTKVTVIAHANIPEIQDIEDYDFAAILLSFPSGTIGIIDISRSGNFGYDQRMEVFGSKGMIKVENQQPIPNVEIYTGPECLRKTPFYYSFPSRYQVAYANELMHFIDVVQGKCQPRISDKDILAGCKIAAACSESAKNGKMVDILWDKEELPY